MARFTQAKYHTALKVAEFITDDGRHLLRCGGTLPWRINNCGDLSSPTDSQGKPAPKRTRDFIGFAQVPSKHTSQTHHFFIFPDYESGRGQLEASLKRKYSQHSIPDLVKKYAPSGDNDSQQYARDLLRSTGIASDQKIEGLSATEFTKLADAIEHIEGYHNEADTRKEIWVPVSTVVATNGSQPLADEEIVLRVDGQDTTVRSNSVGQFPPIVHKDKPVAVLHRQADGRLKALGTLSGDKGQHYTFWNQVEHFFGMSGPDKPPASVSSKRAPFTYTVQPHDTLSHIAARFKTTPDKIKADNALRNDKIFAGELLGIYNPLPHSPKAPPKAKPKKSAPKAQAPLATHAEPAPKRPPAANIATTAARSNEGQGQPLAMIPPDQKRAPWMVYAVAEAKRFKGAPEAEIEKSMNYATAVKTGQTTMVGNHHPWCAAFVNWCLMQAGYPIDNTEFHDHVAAKGRAHGFFEVEGQKANKRDKHAPMVRNPLFVEIKKPIYGAIAMVTSPSGHGHHVGFVYAEVDSENVVLLGGNQSDQINFSQQNTAPIAASEIKNKNGDVVKVVEANEDRLLYFVPAAYAMQARKDQSGNDLQKSTAPALNGAFNIISAKNKRRGQTR